MTREERAYTDKEITAIIFCTTTLSVGITASDSAFADAENLAYSPMTDSRSF